MHLLGCAVPDGFRQEVAQTFHKAGLPDAGSLAEREPLQSGILGALWRANAFFSDSDLYLPTDHAQALLAVASDPSQPHVPGHILFTKSVEAEMQNVLEAKPRAAPESAVEAERQRMRVAELEAQVREFEKQKLAWRAQEERNVERLSREGHAHEDPPPPSRKTGKRPRRFIPPQEAA